MSLIQSVHGREVLDSRGLPTVEVDVLLDSGLVGRAAVPSGASTGSREALELRDNDAKRYHGKGVLQAVEHVNQIIQPKLIDQDPHQQEVIDQLLHTLDGTSNMSHLGANASLAVSLAVAKAAALAEGQPLYAYLAQGFQMQMPVPLMNIINGGAHANNNLDIQEFMIVPHGAQCFREALRIGAEVFYALKSQLNQHGYATAVGDEGGFAPDLASHEAALDFITKAIELAGFKLGQEVSLALDVASSEFYNDGRYHLSSQQATLSSEQLLNYLERLTQQYAIISIEDGMAESDWNGWQGMTERLGQRVQLVGDDIFVTNTELLQQGIKRDVANAILIKPNQIGTLTDTLAAIKMAKAADYQVVISHRSGETEDTTIADLAVATGAGQIKTGSLSRSERVSKYNQLLRIEEVLHGRIEYAGIKAFPMCQEANSDRV